MKDDRVLIVGGGLVGLCTAAALARRGVGCELIAETLHGEASPAAAGMLAPGVEAAVGSAHTFSVAARDMYPEFLRWVRGATGVEIAFDRRGILQLAATAEDVEHLRKQAGADASWLSAGEVARLEPSLAPAAGALLHHKDGAVDNAALVAALRRFVGESATITVHADRALSLGRAPGALSVACASGRQYRGSAVVVAGGAWSGQLKGLPRALPIEPVRGQMLALGGGSVGHVVFGGAGYIVPRDGAETLVGSTMERVGFAPGTTDEALRHLRGVAATVCPALALAAVARHWSGLRPMTPDLQPIVGPDPDSPGLYYACGHSKNGILMAPLTGECVASLISGEKAAYDMSAFSPARFAN